MNFNSNKPIFITIKDHYASLIKKGALTEGSEMPSVREVAISNGVNPNTVQRAFSMLVEEGYLISVPKKGFFVAAVKTVESSNPLLEEINTILSKGYSIEDIEKTLEEIKGNDKH